METKLTPNLWFDWGQAEAAANFYINYVFKGDGRVLSSVDYLEGSPGPEGETMVVEWEMAGMRFVGINGGPTFNPSEAFSIQINCDTQDEIDGYWDAIVSNGGEEGPCGWCKDKFGVSWQITPKGMDQLFGDPDKSKAERAMKAMLEMRKLDMAALQAAANGDPTPA